VLTSRVIQIEIYKKEKEKEEKLLAEVIVKIGFKKEEEE